MNFYLGTNLETLNPNHYNIRIDEEVCKYLYKNKINTKILHGIDPYGDTILFKEDIFDLVKDCELIIDLNKESLDICLNQITPLEDFKNLKKLCEKAIKENKNIICVGD